MLAYEGAARGDVTILKDLEEMIKMPYGEELNAGTTREQVQDVGKARETQWYQKTPPWARDLPGATFLSCSS